MNQLTQYENVPVFSGEPPSPDGFFQPAAPSADGLMASDQARAVAEVQAALVIAASRPRNELRARDRLLQACQRVGLASGAIYKYSRGGTDIQGPSIRLAEVAARAWGNMTYGFRELGRKPGESEVEAFAWDLETNTKAVRQFSIKHWRDTKKGGYALKDERDIYELMANQAQRRVRAAILEIIPGDIIEDAVEECERTQRAHVGDIAEAAAKLTEAFGAFGVSRENIEQRLGHRIDAIQPAQVINLRKIWVSIRDGMSDPKDWFEMPSGLSVESPPAKPQASDKPAAKTTAKAQDKPKTEDKPSPEPEQKSEPLKETVNQETGEVSSGMLTCPNTGKEVDELDCPGCPKRPDCPEWN